MSLSTTQQTELRIQKGIRQAEDDLVLWIQAALDKCEYGNDNDKLEESQFRNLVRVSDTTDSPEVIKNFLRYQVGRVNKWGQGEKSLANQIIQDIDTNLKQKAETIAQESRSSDLREIWLELIRRYLGYGSRYLKYLNSLPENKP